MAIDRRAIGKELGGSSLLITRSRLQNFATAIGQTDPIYRDVEAAREAGHRDLPVPPTFFFGIDLEGDAFGFLDDLGVDLRTILHGEQEFLYHRMAYAGDELRTASRIVDLYDKKGGLLEFVVREIDVTDGAGTPIAQMRTTIVVQNAVAVALKEA